MTKEPQVIRIESILGGQSPTTHFAHEDQFRASMSIDPAQPISDTSTDYLGIKASGLLRPVGTSEIDASKIGSIPLWIIPQPKSGDVFIYDFQGSVYSIESTSFATITGLGDLNDGGSSFGNGAAYSDNYVYFSRATTIARYGPLDGTPAFTDDYWTGTLSKAALSNQTYPTTLQTSVSLPNHYLHRHSDGRLYIADVVDNQGTIHFIKTTKTTVEGDTDDGSTYDAVHVGYGLWPTAIESYGSSLAIAFYEGSSSFVRQARAKIAFWDTTADNVNQITWVEFPDTVISAMKNVNGVLYVVSGNTQGRGFRLSRFVGGYTFEEVFYFEDGSPTYPGALDGDSERLLFGSFTYIPLTSSSAPATGIVYSLGLQNSNLSKGIFGVLTAPNVSVGNNSVAITALSLVDNYNFAQATPLVGFYNGGAPGAGNVGLAKQSTTYSSNHIYWWSQMYRIGQPFKITKIRIPLAQAMAANMAITAKIFTDDGAGTTHTLTTIDNTNYSGKKNIVIRPENLTGDHNFWLELNWTGSALCVVGLPITIEYEFVND